MSRCPRVAGVVVTSWPPDDPPTMVVDKPRGYRVITPREAGLAVGILMSAYADDPMFRYLSPSPIKRRSTLYVVFRVAVEIGLAQGEVWIDDSNRGCAVFVNPGSRGFGAVRTVPSAMSMLWRVGLGNVERLLRLVDELERLRPQKRHYNLMFLGVVPTGRRQGIATRLVEGLIDRAASDDAVVHLETFDDVNLSFGTHMGLILTDLIATDAKAGPPVWAMVWKPLAANVTGIDHRP